MVSPKDSCNPREWTKGYEHGMKESLNLIATQGAADVVPVVHGRWMWELADNGWANWMCSGCGYTRNVDVHVVMDWNYCPYCGAHMKEGDVGG